jgi:hypothetical protein
VAGAVNRARLSNSLLDIGLGALPGS